jgi:hypothetical protein
MSKESFSLNPAEIAMRGSASAFGRRTKLSRASRKVDDRSLRIEMEHIPTGVMVHGDVPCGHYSKNEMRALRAKLEAELFARLTVEVMKHLRTPGR